MPQLYSPDTKSNLTTSSYLPLVLASKRKRYESIVLQLSEQEWIDWQFQSKLMPFLLLAKNGDSNAFRCLLEMSKTKSIIQEETASYFLKGGNEQDINQTALLGFWEAIKDYNPSKKKQFFNFARLCIRRQLISGIKADSRQKHQALNNSIRLEKPIGDQLEIGDILLVNSAKQLKTEPLGEEAEEIQQSLINLFEEQCPLSKLEIVCLSHYLIGFTYKEIMTILGISYKTVDNALQRAKRKIAAHLDIEDFLS